MDNNRISIKIMLEREMPQQSTLVVIAKKSATEIEFIDYWSRLYKDPRPKFYSENIGKPLTPARLRKLFEWKNGGPIAAHKKSSIEKNYIQDKPLPPRANDRQAHINFITGSGGAIWRIFWLHCYDQDVYPIFDQHVFRAMKDLKTGVVAELPKTAKTIAAVYYDEYIPFWSAFTTKERKRLDEALWSYGKFLTRYAL